MTTAANTCILKPVFITGNTSDADDYVKATFYKVENSHTGYNPNQVLMINKGLMYSLALGLFSALTK